MNSRGGVRRYGVWVGNRQGTPEDPMRCVEGIWERAVERQCTRKRGHGPDGEYCRQHTDALARREAARKRLS